MIDVDEVYKMPNSRLKSEESKKPSNLKDAEKKNESAADEVETKVDPESVALADALSHLNLYKSSRFNMFERHVNQLLIRGDNVVTITLADN
jgi:hypothetical protein